MFAPYLARPRRLRTARWSRWSAASATMSANWPRPGRTRWTGARQRTASPSANGAICANSGRKTGSTGELTRRVGRQGPTTVVAVQLLEKAGLVTVAKSDRRSPQKRHPPDAARTKAGGNDVAADPRRERSGDGRSDRQRNSHLQATHRPHPANARCAKRKPQRVVRAAHATVGRGSRTLKKSKREKEVGFQNAKRVEQTCRNSLPFTGRPD